jgi:hypothetical protein
MYFNEHTCETMAILGMPALDDLSAVADPAVFEVGPGLPQIPDDQGNGALE